MNYVISANVVFMSWRECQQKACSFIDNAFVAMFVSVICCLATMHSMLTKMITMGNSIANCITIEWYTINQNKLRRNLTMVIIIFAVNCKYILIHALESEALTRQANNVRQTFEMRHCKHCLMNSEKIKQCFLHTVNTFWQVMKHCILLF